MDTDLKVERCFNSDIIKTILTHPWIYERISEDGQKLSDSMLNFEKNCFLKLRNEADEIIGCYILHAFNGATLQIHANVLPSFREKYAKQSGHAVLDWIKKNSPPHFQKIIALIPEIYPDVYHFTRKFGFKDEGLLLKAYRKNNQLHNISILGIMRADI